MAPQLTTEPSPEEKGAPFPALFTACRHYAKTATGIDITAAAAPTVAQVELYTAAMLVCCAADGELHPHELEWIVGHQAAFGAPASVLGSVDALKTRWTRDEVLEKIEADPQLRRTKGCLVFHCLCASGADGELADEEVECTRGVAKALGVMEEEFEELLGLYKAQASLNKKILGALWKEKNPYE